MSKQYSLTQDQILELKAAQKANKDKNAENRLKALLMRAEGKKHAEIAVSCGYHPSHVSKLVSKYCNQGLSALVENHYLGNRRNMSVAEEEEFLSEYRRLAEEGQIVEVSSIQKACEEKVGHSIGSAQIYRVLHRHGWRKVVPRSKHPNKASDEAIEAPKKLTSQQGNTFSI